MFIIKQKLYGKLCRAFSAYFVTSAKEEISFPDFSFARILYSGKMQKRRGKDVENKRKIRGKQAAPVLRLCRSCFAPVLIMSHVGSYLPGQTLL